MKKNPFVSGKENKIPILPTENTEKKSSIIQDKNFYIYTGCTNGKHLICFKHQNEAPMKYIIDMIESFGMQDEIASIKELALRADIGKALKDLWKKTGTTYCTNGFLYRIKEIKVIAIICDQLTSYFKKLNFYPSMLYTVSITRKKLITTPFFPLTHPLTQGN